MKILKSDEKYFDGWNDKKKYLHEEKQRPFFKEGEMWFASLGVNMGYEQDGKKQRRSKTCDSFKKVQQ